MSSILVLLVGDIIVARIDVIGELTAVTILYSNETGTPHHQPDRHQSPAIRAYGPFSVEDVTKLAAHASRTENQDVIDT